MSSSTEPIDRPSDAAGEHGARHPEQHTPQPPPDSVQAHLMAATALLRANEPDAAVRALESVVARAPGQPMPRYQLAVACAMAGGHECALSNLGQAVEAGFRRPDLLEAEPAFAPYRSSSAYQTNLELARHNCHPCAGDPDRRAFDFFVGHWQVSTAEGVVAGINRIEPVLGGGRGRASSPGLVFVPQPVLER